MTCEIFKTDEKELECRRLILHSIECALKRGDDIFEKLTRNNFDNDPKINYKKFKDGLKTINHENLKK